jgi:glucose/arabinose dehydrogenase
MRLTVLTVVSCLFLSSVGCARAGSLPLEHIKLPPGFSIEVYAEVPNARGMVLGTGGTLFVGSKKQGRVYAVVDDEGSHGARRVYTIASDLRLPLGVAFKDGSLYASSTDRILRFDNIEQRLTSPPSPVVVTDRLPKETSHGGKYLGFGPDDKLYVAVGVPCNICEPEADRYGHIARMNRDGSGYEIVARGVRNSVGFAWDPNTRHLWFTDNGRDWMGDDQPPDELNHAASDGMHFGYPHCHGSSVADPKYGTDHPCDRFTAPALELGPHVAALGMRFYTGNMFPSEYQGRVFIAEHGSWNRSGKIGYRISQASKDQQGQWQYSIFAQGWLQGSEAWGRPADVLVMPDGALLVSDDQAGMIYRITYRQQ